jgi:hypothetical protein
LKNCVETQKESIMQKERTPLKIKIKDGNPSIENTMQKRTQVNTTQRKKKNQVKTLCKEDS